MKLTLKVDLGEGPYEVTTSLYVIVQWERKYKRKASQISEGIGIEDLAYMAYESSRSQGITVPALLDDYIRLIKNLEVVEQNDPKVDAVLTATD